VQGMGAPAHLAKSTASAHGEGEKWGPNHDLKNSNAAARQ
jgi:hypothetical protein